MKAKDATYRPRRDDMSTKTDSEEKSLIKLCSIAGPKEKEKWSIDVVLQDQTRTHIRTLYAKLDQRPDTDI